MTLHGAFGGPGPGTGGGPGGAGPGGAGGLGEGGGKDDLSHSKGGTRVLFRASVWVSVTTEHASLRHPSTRYMHEYFQLCSELDPKAK